MNNGFAFEAWPAEFKVITQKFGARPWFYLPAFPGHEGVDFKTGFGTKIFCVAPGTVIEVRQDDQVHAYGTHVRVQHEGRYQTVYAHLQEAHVSQNQRVEAGHVLGLSGDSGNAQGPHLHLTLKHPDGDQHRYPSQVIDPTPFLRPFIDTDWHDATYLRDSIPDGTVMQIGQSFIQSWVLRNSGTKVWKEGYKLVRIGGDALGAAQEVPLPVAPPGAEVPVAILFRTPQEPGTYRSTWQPCDANGNRFGDPVWVEIEVPAPRVLARQGRRTGFVRTEGTRFLREGREFRFYGVNLRGLAHYGRRQSDPLQYSRLEHRQSQLAAAHATGARVVRLFLAEHNVDTADIVQRLRELLDLVTEHYPDLYLLPAFTNLYNDVPFFPRGDEGYFASDGHRDLLNKAFFAGGYRENYLPFVETIVQEFRDEPNIFAWEIGNELKLDRENMHDAGDPNPWLFIRFNLDVAATIKRLDPNHMVTTGMKSTHHAWLHTAELQDALYTSPNIDFLTIHSYEGKWDQEGDRRVWDDVGVAARLGKPFIVEEAGFDVDVHSDRVAKHRTHLDTWFGQGARGYMTWGFIHEHAIGDGDNDVGVGANHPDFGALCDLFRRYAEQFNAASRGLTPHGAPPPAHMPVPRQGVAGFDFWGYNRTFHNNPDKAVPINDAAGYGVRIRPAEVAPGESYWRVIGIHHLTPEENTRRHNVYLDLLDEQGQRIAPRDHLRIGWIWEGKADGPADPKALEKPDNEPITDVPLEKNMTVRLWVEGEGASDSVEGLHSRHDDEATGNAWGHHSFYVVFQKARKAATAPPVEPDAQEADGTNSQNGSDSFDPSPAPDSEQQTQIFIPIAPVSHANTGRDKLGIDANAPIDERTGRIMPQVADPGVIADTGAGWVRLNFIVGQQWSGPLDQNRVDGRTWQETYAHIIRGFRNRGLKIYALISDQAVQEDFGDALRNAPPADAGANHPWIDRYVDNFVTILGLFKEEIAVVESFNEPDDWHGGHQNWVHPGWFAIILQRLHEAVRGNPAFHHIPLVSGPLQGLGHNGNGAARYLDQTYRAGIERYRWGSSGRPFPFDGVGYHLYVEEKFNPDHGAHARSIRKTYREYLGEMRATIRRHEGRLKQLYISEMGWFTNGGDREARERFQAANLRLSLNLLLHDPTVALTVLFCTQDFESHTNDKYYGLYRVHGLGSEDRKPAFDAYQTLCAQPISAARPDQQLQDAADGHPPVQQALVNDAEFVRDLVPDGSTVDAGSPFANTWTLRNTGDIPWTAGYKLALIGGEAMGAAQPVPIAACAPGAEIDVTVNFVAPQEPGRHESFWKLATPDGRHFGERVWVKIHVPAPRITTVAEALAQQAEGAATRGATRSATRSATHSAAGTARSPQPLQPEQMGGKTLKEYDPELYAAWSEHVRQGFENNTIMFNRILKGFMTPYQTTIWMYRILFAVGILAFVAAVVLAALAETTGQALGMAALFGGLGVVTFLSYFISRPMQALEENLQFITWLGIVYNTYWSRLTYAMDHDTFHQLVEDANNDAIKSINEMLDKHAAFNKGRPGLR